MPTPTGYDWGPDWGPDFRPTDVLGYDWGPDFGVDFRPVPEPPPIIIPPPLPFTFVAVSEYVRVPPNPVLRVYAEYRTIIVEPESMAL
jgi:hypothetical protein